MDWARARPAKKTPTNQQNCCVRTVLLPVQCIDDNNWQQDIIFSLNTSNLKAPYKQLTKCFWNIPLGWIRSSNRLCFTGLYHLGLKHLSQTNAKKAFQVTHCCGLYTLHYFLNREGLILCSLELVLHGSNCSDLNEVNPCIYQNKCKKS